MPDDFDRLIARMKRLDASARVGALDEENARKLAYQEFGTETAPMRPTLSVTTDRLKAAMDRAVDRRLRDAMDGKGTASGEAILRAVGEDLREEVVAAIENNTPPPLAPSTLANRRGRGNPSTRSLVDTGDMRDAIKVETKAGTGDWADGE